MEEKLSKNELLTRSIALVGAGLASSNCFVLTGWYGWAIFGVFYLAWAGYCVYQYGKATINKEE